MLAIGQKYLSFYPPSFSNIYRVIISNFFLVNNFSVDYEGLHKDWANTSLFIIPDASNFESTCKKPPFIKDAIFC